MAKLLLGKEVNAALQTRVSAQVEELKKQGIVPTLAIIRVGEKEADLAYERGASKRCEKLGIGLVKMTFPENAGQDTLLRAVDKVNRDCSIHGVLILRPLPSSIDETAVVGALAPEKDVDGITAGSMLGLYTAGKAGFPPCTASAVLEILDHYGIDPAGKRAVVIGRSLVIGKPVAMMLLKRNATVTICHTKTTDMASVAREADILIAAAGHPGIVDRSFVRKGQVVIDVGINVDKDGRLCGDVCFEEAEPVVDAITPVPGGVGSVTTSVLAAHTVQAAARNNC